ncbi:hypothetical protein FHX42_001480 [Saccharopolyspora lacisalsi]|uniref:Uncharacterized protein n=1 Tax=Halosaccharopolyspora lacisalsi TaxID=1000566 RepID=A0A839DY48_9PSEU|nr:hypothetical protein [Halosaccharopolyspora lacisalsi]MBA8824151.1 hypothetical protein [Halosaccharopolyspora lacisalsi]
MLEPPKGTDGVVGEALFTPTIPTSSASTISASRSSEVGATSKGLNSTGHSAVSARAILRTGMDGEIPRREHGDDAQRTLDRLVTRAGNHRMGLNACTRRPVERNAATSRPRGGLDRHGNRVFFGAAGLGQHLQQCREAFGAVADPAFGDQLALLVGQATS